MNRTLRVILTAVCIAIIAGCEDKSTPKASLQSSDPQERLKAVNNLDLKYGGKSK